MKKRIIFLTISILMVLLPANNIYGQSKTSANYEFESIFNGQNWDGWYLKIRDGNEALAKKVFSIEDGMVHVFKNMPDSFELGTGKNATHGLFYTHKKYSRYILRFQYKWGNKIANNFDQWQYDAGCYYHVIDDQIWPKGFEYQIRYNHITDKNHTGDLIISGTKARWYSNENKEFCLPKNGGIPKTYKEWMYLASPDVEYNALNDKWNQCEIIVMGDKYAIHKLNGKIVNMVSDLSVSEGVIGFQAETAELFYRNIEIKEFDENVPMEKFLSE
jgi:hypothetical protein